MEDCQTIKRIDLYGVEMMSVARLESSKAPTDLIVKNIKTHLIEVKTENEWNELIYMNESDSYLVIVG